MRPRHELTGKTFGMLSVLGFSHIDIGGNTHWDCACECGGLSSPQGTKLVSGLVSSCGCIGSTGFVPKHRLAMGEASFNAYYNQYGRGAESREYNFPLTKDEFRKLTKQDCHYCGMPPRDIPKHSPNMFGGYNGNGIDRMNNESDYSIENCLPCCSTCNVMKGTQTYEDFIKQVRNIYERLIADR